MSTASPSPLDSIKTLPIEEAIRFLGDLSDSVYALDHDVGLALINDAIPATEAVLDKQSFEDLSCIHLLYVLANLWGHRYRLKAHADENYLWVWDSEEHTEELASLRKAVAHPGFDRLDSPTRCSILTNLGNSLDRVGRPLEAIECWENAITIDPAFPMAHGNLGVGLSTYGISLYDPGHTALFLHFAQRCLEKSLAGPLHKDELKYFQERRDHVAHLLPGHYPLCIADLNASSIGKSRSERLYRQWCLKERLFLNPLNDLGNYAIAARDVLHCPPITKEFSDEMIPWEHKLINQLKQEFVSARFMLYEALQLRFPHFADRENVIINTLDYASNSLRTERIKTALRTAYSLLDKVAWFLDEYFFRKTGAGAKDRVYFQSVWHENNRCKRELKPAFRDRKNWPLRGLYSLRNDFFLRKTHCICPQISPF